MNYIQRVIQTSPLAIHPLAYTKLQTCRMILDVGCGPGRLASLFRNTDLIGADLRSEGRICLKNGYKGFYQADVEIEALPRLEADGLILSHILEHFVRPERALANVFQALRPGALVYAIVPTVRNAHYYDDYTHIRPFTERALIGLFSDIGLQEPTILYEFQAPFRGAGRLIRLWTKGNPRREHELCKRHSRLRAQANVHAIANMPNADETKDS